MRTLEVYIRPTVKHARFTAQYPFRRNAGKLLYFLTTRVWLSKRLPVLSGIHHVGYSFLMLVFITLSECDVYL